MRPLTKQVFLQALVCPTLGWHLRRDDAPLKPGEGQRFLLDQGREVGRRARARFPDGVLIEERDPEAAEAATHAALAAAPALFEAAFSNGECRARADVLLREADGWRLIEVKSGLDPRPEYLDDLAYTAMVVLGAGLRVVRTELALVSRDYRLGMPDAALFVLHDVSAEVRARLSTMQRLRPAIERATAAAEPSPPRLRKACNGCPMYGEGCLGTGIEHPVLELPRLREDRIRLLARAGVEAIAQIPDDFPLTPTQVRVRDSVHAGHRHVGPGLAAALAPIAGPTLHLDFETVSSAIPLFPEVAPHEAVPFQYSVHACDAPGRVVDHREHLADPAGDPRRALAAQLLADLRGEAPIVTYSSYESRVLGDLAACLPDLAPALEALRARLFDLHAVIRRHVYDPAFHGSFSIKRVLPALVPDLSYDDLAIADGGAASAVFARMVMGEITGDDAQVRRRELLAYCRRDTEAMVRLHAVLDGL